MKKSYVLRLTRRLLTLGALVGCLLMLAPTQAKASWLDCWSDFQYSQWLCEYRPPDERPECRSNADLAFFVCEAGNGSGGIYYEIWP